MLVIDEFGGQHPISLENRGDAPVSATNQSMSLSNKPPKPISKPSKLIGDYTGKPLSDAYQRTLAEFWADVLAEQERIAKLKRERKPKGDQPKSE